MKNLKKLYNEALKYNCSYYESKSKYQSDLLIVFIGTHEFIITNNYWGCVAFGVRSYDYDKEASIYTYRHVSTHVSCGNIEGLIRKYENKRLNIKKVIINREEL